MTKLKVVSNNKVRANRLNAKKSTGPRTLSGKEIKDNVFNVVAKIIYILITFFHFQKAALL